MVSSIFLRLVLVLLGIVLTAVHGLSCNTCQGCCFSDISSTLCRCGADCQEFGDCCGKNYGPTLLLSNGVKVVCHSVIIDQNSQVKADDEAFLMVSSCPHSFENDVISGNCSVPNQPLPPVTDLTTGLVYRNEYCARCNEVTEIVGWPFKLFCSEKLHNLIANPTEFEAFISAEPDFLKNECTPCSSIPPNLNYTNIKTPRSCIPRIETCLSQFELQRKTNESIGADDYAELVGNCENGDLNLVSKYGGQVYRNRACATCNGVNDNEVKCFELEVRDFCDLSSTMCRLPRKAMSKVENKITAVQRTAESTRKKKSEQSSVKANTRQEKRELMSSASVPPECGPFTYTITLRNLGGGQTSLSTADGTRNVITACVKGQILVGTECRSTFCPDSYTQTGGRCLFTIFESEAFNESFQNVNFTSSNCSNPIILLDSDSYTYFDNDTILLLSIRENIEILGFDDLGRPIICPPHSFTCELVVLNTSEYKTLGNSSILIGGKIVKVMFYDMHGRPLICPELVNPFNTIELIPSLPGMDELTYIGCSLSVLGCVAVLLTYSIFKELQTFPGIVLMNLCISVCCTSIIFIIGSPVIQYYPLKEICITSAVALHFFYLSQFSWMSVFSFEMTRTFYQARKMGHDTRETKRKYFVMYLVLGWVLPLTTIIVTVILNFKTEGLVLYGVDREGAVAGCWINHYLTFIITFVAPVVLSLLCNLSFFAVTTCLLCKAYKEQAKVHKGNIFTMARVWLAIFTISGLTWIFGFLSNFQDVNWMWYLFVIFNSIQGFSIFLAFVFTRRVFKLYRTLFCKKLKSVSSYYLGNRATSRSTLRSTGTLRKLPEEEREVPPV